jgi:hypothetical protein
LAALVRDPLLLDLDRLFPMDDVLSARLMKLKAHCLARAGVLTEDELMEVEERAQAYLRNPRFRAALQPRRAA